MYKETGRDKSAGNHDPVSCTGKHQHQVKPKIRKPQPQHCLLAIRPTGHTTDRPCTFHSRCGELLLPIWHQKAKAIACRGCGGVYHSSGTDLSCEKRKRQQQAGCPFGATSPRMYDACSSATSQSTWGTDCDTGWVSAVEPKCMPFLWPPAEPLHQCHPHACCHQIHELSRLSLSQVTSRAVLLSRARNQDTTFLTSRETLGHSLFDDLVCAHKSALVRIQLLHHGRDVAPCTPCTHQSPGAPYLAAAPAARHHGPARP